MTGLPQGVESQDSEQFFRKVLGVSDGSSLGGMKPILEGSKGELNRSALPQRALLSGVYKGMPSDGHIIKTFFEVQNHICCMIEDFVGTKYGLRFKWSLAWDSNMENLSCRVPALSWNDGSLSWPLSVTVF